MENKDPPNLGVSEESVEPNKPRGLGEQPAEILSMIVQELSFRDRVQLGKVCRRLYFAYQDSRLRLDNLSLSLGLNQAKLAIDNEFEPHYDLDPRGCLIGNMHGNIADPHQRKIRKFFGVYSDQKLILGECFEGLAIEDLVSILNHRKITIECLTISGENGKKNQLIEIGRSLKLRSQLFVNTLKFSSIPLEEILMFLPCVKLDIIRSIRFDYNGQDEKFRKEFEKLKMALDHFGAFNYSVSCNFENPILQEIFSVRKVQRLSVDEFTLTVQCEITIEGRQ